MCAPLARRALRRCFPALLFASIVETKIDGALWLVPCASFPFHALYAALVLAAAPRCFAEDDENFMGILLSCLGQNYGLVYPLILGTSLRDTNAFAAIVLFDLAGNAILILIFNDFLAARRAPRRENDEAENPMKPSDESEAPVEDPDRGDAHAMSMLALPPRRLRALPKTLRNTLGRLASSPPLVGELLGIACQLLPVRVPGPVVGFAQWVGQPYSLILFVIIALTIDVPTRAASGVIAKVLGFRLALAAVAAAGFSVWFPDLGGARGGIVIGLFAPLSSMNVRYLIENGYPAASKAIYANVFTVSNVVSFIALWALIARYT